MDTFESRTPERDPAGNAADSAPLRAAKAPGSRVARPTIETHDPCHLLIRGARPQVLEMILEHLDCPIQRDIVACFQDQLIFGDTVDWRSFKAQYQCILPLNFEYIRAYEIADSKFTERERQLIITLREESPTFPELRLISHARHAMSPDLAINLQSLPEARRWTLAEELAAVLGVDALADRLSHAPIEVCRQTPLVTTVAVTESVELLMRAKYPQRQAPPQKRAPEDSVWAPCLIQAIDPDPGIRGKMLKLLAPARAHDLAQIFRYAEAFVKEDGAIRFDRFRHIAPTHTTPVTLNFSEKMEVGSEVDYETSKLPPDAVIEEIPDSGEPDYGSQEYQHTDESGDPDTMAEIDDDFEGDFFRSVLIEESTTSFGTCQIGFRSVPEFMGIDIIVEENVRTLEDLGQVETAEDGSLGLELTFGIQFPASSDEVIRKSAAHHWEFAHQVGRLVGLKLDVDNIQRNLEVSAELNQKLREKHPHVPNAQSYHTRGLVIGAQEY